MMKNWSVQSGPGHETPSSEQASGAAVYRWQRPPGVDPYFRWALHTDWRGFARLGGWDDADRTRPQKIHIIAATCDQGTDQAVAKVHLDAALACKAKLAIPASYEAAMPGAGERACWFTATVSRDDAEWLLRNPLGLRWKLAMPMRDAERVARGSANGLFGRERDLLEFRGDNVVKGEIRGQKVLRPPGALPGAIALIDNGCPFLNLVFQDARGTRVAALWDQGSETPPGTDPRVERGEWPWQLPAAFGYGRELGPTALNLMTRAVRRRPEIDETMVYRGIDHLIDYEDPRRRIWFATHGGHLLHVAGGNPDPLSGETADAASGAALVFVQLPLLAAMDSAGASLAPHILDGVRYAMSLCPAGQPLVVSISYGGQAGPHDGSSPIEEALQELLENRRDNFAIVLAAGNARLVRAHASRLLRAERSVLLRCQMPAGDTTDSFIELWYDDPPPGLSVELRVSTPDGVWSPWVAPGQEVIYRESGFSAAAAGRPPSVPVRQLGANAAPALGNEVVAMLRHDLHVPNGRRALALLALAPTAAPMEVICALADAGLWQIEVRLVVAASNESKPVKELPSVRIDAWFERDDPGLGTGAQRAFFEDQTPEDEFDTLSSLASNATTIRVGGFNLATREPAPYSALGNALRPGPDLLAACEEDEVQPSVAATATRSGEICRLNGSSVSAPVLARRLYNLMTLGSVRREDWPEVLKQIADDPEEPCVRPPPVD